MGEMAVDAQGAAFRAVEIASREIERLGKKDSLGGFDAMDLAGYAKLCLAYDNHTLTWMSKLAPEKLEDELVRRAKKELAEDGKPTPAPRARRAAAG